MLYRIKRKLRGRKIKRYMFTATFMIAIFVMSLGYAALSQYMEIEGMAIIEKRWKVEITDVTVANTNSGAGVKNFTTGSTVVSLDTTLPNPTSTVTYTITFKNSGNVKGILHSIDKIEDKNTNITYSISGVTIGTTIAAGGSVTATVTVQYKSGATSVSTEPKKMMLGFNFVEYKSGSEGSSSFPRRVTVVANNGTIENGTSLSNLIINGGYETNDKWTLSGASIISSGCYSGNRCLRFDDAGLSMTTQTITKADGTTPMAPSLNHKYYGRIMFKSSSNYTVADSRFEWYTDDLDGARLMFAHKNIKTNNKWQLMSSIQQVTINTHLSKSWHIRNFTVSQSETVYVDEAMIIDLTEAYGSGKEPSKEWLDENISFFEGTVSHISSTVSGQAVYKISPNVGYVFESVEGCSASYNASTNILRINNTVSEENCTVNFKKATLVDRILADNNEQSDAGIDITKSNVIYYNEVHSATTTSVIFPVGLISAVTFATDYTFDESTGVYILSGTKKSESWSNMTSEYGTYPYTCVQWLFGDRCATMYKMVGYTDNDEGVGYAYTYGPDETRYNGKGLYYTSTNTENNQRTYYFRGAVENNYVQFGKDSNGNDLYWKIIRINEDGSIRIIYNGTNTTTTGADVTIGDSKFNANYDDNAYVGYMYGTPGSSTYSSTHANTNDSTIKDYLDEWYENNLSSYSSYLADSGFCNDRSVAPSSGLWYSSDTALGYAQNTTYYGASNRLSNNKTPQFACPNASNDLFTTSTSSKGNKALTNPIGLITADEAWYAGDVVAMVSGTNTTHYLYTGSFYWAMSPSHFDGSNAYEWILSGDLKDQVDYEYGVRPVINLKSTVTLSSTNPSGCSSQNGTASCPYVID